jgi:phosphonate metabolism-associated iron-containing alcohol dehydrogenase
MNLSEKYSFSNPTRIVFGIGRVAELATIVSAKRVCLVTSAGFTKRGMTQRLHGMFGERLVHVVDTIDPNPNLDSLDTVIRDVREVRPDVVVALGGGSAMDSGKVIAKTVSAPEGWTLAVHFRGGRPIHNNSPLPCYVLPTTSGTGAEVTPFATVWDQTTNTKYSLANDDMFPVAAIVDPQLTVGMPREVTLSTGLDAISQALESVWNRSCNAITFGWAISSLRLSLKALLPAANTPEDLKARSDMAQASLLAGLCISHTRTALAHSMSYPITAHYGMPHGFACSFTLPALFDFNIEVDDGRLAALANALGYADAQALKIVLVQLLADAKIGNYFRKYLSTPIDILKHVSEMITPNRSENNMRRVDLPDIERIVRDTFGKYILI